MQDRKEYNRQYYLKNRHTALAYSKEYYSRHKPNKSKRKLYHKKWYAANKEKRLIQCRNYYTANKEAILKKNSIKTNFYRKNNLNFKLAHILRVRLMASIKNGQKSGSAVGDLGCSIQELKKYLESQFKPGMTWENWSSKGWHIDHIMPLCKFDLSDRTQFLKACHYTNLQPLWAKDNLSKSKQKYGND